MNQQTSSQWYHLQFDGLALASPKRVTREERPITVWCHQPQQWTVDSPVVFVMPGVKRNGREYRDAWITHSERQRFLLLVPEFSKKYYPGIRTYHLGNTFSPSGKPIAESKWTYTAIESLFDAVKAFTQCRAEHYSIYGHSAGAQFVHRLVLFLPEARIKTAVCANAGWYTMPAYKRKFPYGLKSSGITEAELARAFARKLIVLIGNKDTDTNHKYLQQTPQASAQGQNRFKRGKRFYRTAQREAEKLRIPLQWELIIVRNIGHNHAKISKAAIKKLAS